MFNKGNKRKANQEKKNKYASKSLTRVIVSLFVAILAWIGATTFEAYLLSDKNVAEVIVAEKNIPSGTLIDESNRNKYFSIKTVNSNLVTKETLTKLENVSGKTATNISSGEIITSHRFYDTEIVNYNLKDPVEITFTVNSADKAVCGRIRKGDLIDIIGIIEDDKQGPVSKEIKKNVYVLEAYDSAGVVIDSADTESQAISFKIYIERSEVPNCNMMFGTAEITVAKVINTD